MFKVSFFNYFLHANPVFVQVGKMSFSFLKNKTIFPLRIFYPFPKCISLIMYHFYNPPHIYHQGIFYFKNVLMKCCISNFCITLHMGLFQVWTQCTCHWKSTSGFMFKNWMYFVKIHTQQCLYFESFSFLL